jgi:cobalt-zinc-cadmium efflux system protein
MTHDRHSSSSPGVRHRRSLAAAFAMIAGFMVVEVVAAFVTGSLTLLSDAGHMATDALGLGMALAAVTATSRTTRTSRHTYGVYRLEIFAAFANALLLLGVGGYVLFEAARRFRDPPEVLSEGMLAVAAAGLVVNLVALRLLRSGSQESLNVEAAFTEVLADVAGSIAAVAAAVILLTTGWRHADPLFAAAIGIFILPRGWRLAAKATRIMLQAAPDHVDVDRVRTTLARLGDVIGVHDLHVWTLTSGMEVASVHLVTKEAADPHAVLDRARDLLAAEFGIEHATLQVEPASHEGCAELTY